MYVRIQQLQDGKGVKTKRTATQKGTWDPVYNESFTFSTQGKEVDTWALQATVRIAYT